METKAFLESDVLYKMLEKQECMLDVKVHPIFQKYADNFIGSNDRIHLKSSINEEDYSLMITDFSSYMFDFRYLGTAVFSFIPDSDRIYQNQAPNQFLSNVVHSSFEFL